MCQVLFFFECAGFFSNYRFRSALLLKLAFSCDLKAAKVSSNVLHIKSHFPIFQSVRAFFSCDLCETCKILDLYCGYEQKSVRNTAYNVQALLRCVNTAK